MLHLQCRHACIFYTGSCVHVDIDFKPSKITSLVKHGQSYVYKKKRMLSFTVPKFHHGNLLKNKKNLLQQKHFRKISFPQLILQQCSVQVYKSPSVPGTDLWGLFNHRHVHSCSWKAGTAQQYVNFFPVNTSSCHRFSTVQYSKVNSYWHQYMLYRKLCQTKTASSLKQQASSIMATFLCTKNNTAYAKVQQTLTDSQSKPI